MSRRALVQNTTVSALALALTLSGCAASREADAIITETSAERARLIEHDKTARDHGVIVEDLPYHGAAIPVTPTRDAEQGRPLPPEVLARRYRISTPQPRGIGDIRATIEAATGLPVRVRRTLPGPDGTVIHVPVGGAMRLDHDGPLPELLDQVAARFDMAWHWDGVTLRFDRFVTRTWRLPVPVQDTNFNTEIAMPTGAFTGTSEQAPWDAIIGQVAALAPPPARIAADRGLGTLTITAPPSVISAVVPVMAAFDHRLSTRIGIDMALLLVDAEASDDYNLGLDLRLAFGNTAIAADFPAGAVTLTTPDPPPLIQDPFAAVPDPLAPGSDTLILDPLALIPDPFAIIPTPLAGTRVNLRALSRDRRVVDSHFFSDVTQPGVVVPFTAGETRTYIRSVTCEGTGDTGRACTLEPGEVRQGVFVKLLMRLIDAGRLHLTVTISRDRILNLDELRARPAPGTIHLPETETRVVHKSVVLAPGETLVLAGYEKETAARDDRGTGRPAFFWLGGGRAGAVTRTRLIVLIRPTLLPPATAGRT